MTCALNRPALVSGHDGLDDLRLIAQAPAHLDAAGWLLLEHGYDQAPAMRPAGEGFEEVHSRIDLGGHERITLGSPPVMRNDQELLYSRQILLQHVDIEASCA